MSWAESCYCHVESQLGTCVLCLVSFLFLLSTITAFYKGTSVSEMMVQAGHAAWRDALPSSRCSLDSAPGPLVEEALNAVEEEDLRKSTQHLPILRSMSDHVLARAGSVSSSVPPLPSPLAE